MGESKGSGKGKDDGECVLCSLTVADYQGIRTQQKVTKV